MLIIIKSKYFAYVTKEIDIMTKVIYSFATCLEDYRFRSLSIFAVGRSDRGHKAFPPNVTFGSVHPGLGVGLGPAVACGRPDLGGERRSHLLGIQLAGERQPLVSLRWRGVVERWR